MHRGHEFVNGALHVAEVVRRRHPQHALPEEVNGHFAEMGWLAVELATNA